MMSDMVSSVRSLSSVLVAGIAACVLVACAGSPPFQRTILHGPYKDVSLAMDAQTHVIGTLKEGRVVPAVEVLPRGSTLSWAFAVGECGSETLGGRDAQRVAAANIGAFERAGIDFIVSTGGQGGVFSCSSDAGMQAFIARYASPRFVGIDFDIEASQTPAMVDALIARAVAAQRVNPLLRFSFTLPTLAASDGSRVSLVAQGISVLASIRRQGLTRYTINLMAMDYGPPFGANCVVGTNARGEPACDMASSAIQAAENLHALHGVPFDQIELTPMLGVNDTAANDFNLADVQPIGSYVLRKGLAGLHLWSLDRDVPCERPASGASPVCSGLPDVPSLAFTRALDKSLR